MASRRYVIASNAKTSVSEVQARNKNELKLVPSVESMLSSGHLL